MTCPRCGRDGCRCAVTQPCARTYPRISFSHEHEPELVDPESNDTSEQQFEDSLLSSSAPEYRSIQLGPERSLQNEVSSVAENASAPEMPATSDLAASGIERHANEARTLDRQSDNWRDEVASRLSNYAKRRGRRSLGGQYSMQLDFDHPRRSNIATAAALAPEIEDVPPSMEMHAAEAPQFEPEPSASEADWLVSSVAHTEPVPECAPQPTFEPPPPPPAPERPKRKQPRIIEFPRLFAVEHVETASDELAETLNAPRILDVPEETEQIVLPLADISLEMQQAAAVQESPLPDFDVPIQVAGISQRMFAALADSTIVLFATAVFAGVVLNIAKDLPHNKVTLLAAALVPCVLWSVYHYLFLVHAAKTPGMAVAQLRLATFNGGPTTRHSRRTRALSLVLSFVSAGMGFGWAFVDEDTLCWHDRISRTYLSRN